MRNLFYLTRKMILRIPFIGKALHSPYMMLQARVISKKNKEKVKILDTLQGSKRIFYMDIPIHPNLGDMAQYICIKKWFEENYPGFQVIELDAVLIKDSNSGFVEKLKSVINKEDMIFFQSGYCTHDLGGDHDLVHRIVVDNFSECPIVMLPQTVFYQNEGNARRTADCYKQHDKMFFMARDRVSFESAEGLFPNAEIKCYPDIVTSLIGTKETSDTNRDGVLFCFRDDSEKFYSDEEIEKLKNKVSQLTTTERLDTTIRADYSQLRNSIDESVFDMIDKYSKAKVIITDRYHGTIFSLIAGTPVIVVKTTDHKVSTGVNWFKGVYDEYVCFAQSLEEAYCMTEKVLNTKYDYQLQPFFKEEYYMKLKTEIETWKNAIV